jgi:hypothetical protein
LYWDFDIPKCYYHCILKNGHKQKRTTESASDEGSLTTSSAEIAFDVMEGNDLNFLSASSAPILATSHLLPLSTTFPSATPKYSLIDASDPSKEELQSPNTNTGRKPIQNIPNYS